MTVYKNSIQYLRLLFNLKLVISNAYNCHIKIVGIALATLRSGKKEWIY